MSGEDSSRRVQRKGQMPPTEEIPEPPRHILIEAGEGRSYRFVDSGHPEVCEGVAHRQHTIVRCGVCGKESSGLSIYRDVEVWMDHNHHFQTSHVGVKVVWRAEDVADRTLSDISEMSRFRYRNDEGPDPIAAYRGDTPDEKVRELVDDEDKPVVVVHQPPAEPYPESIEAGATEGIYVV